MKRFKYVLVVLLAGSFIFSGTQAAQAMTKSEARNKPTPVTAQQQQAIDDLQKITDLRETVRNDERFYKLQGNAPRLEIDKHEAFLNNIIDVEENVIPQINSQLDELAKTYGQTGDEQKATFEKIFKGTEFPLRITGGGSPKLLHGLDLFTSHYTDIKQMFSLVSKTREACIDELLTAVNTDLSSIDAVLVDYRGPIYEKALKALDITLLYDPENKQAKDFIKRIEKESKSALASQETKIDAGEWPGQVKNFSGPGNVNDLSKAALEWFKNDTRTKGWADANPLLVAVKGNWISTKKNIHGETIQWGLPIYLAAHKKKDTDIVRVFSLTILTEKELGVKKEPPFIGASVGNNFDMRLGNLPSSSGDSSGPFIVWQLVLSFALIALGIVAASAKLSTLHPQVKQLVDRLLPYKGLIGAGVGIVGLVFFVKNLLFLAPFSDILPQLVAVVTGLLLGAKIFEEKTKDLKTPEKLAGTADNVHTFFEQNKEKMATMTAYEAILGLACLVTGLLHLVAGGMPLF